MTKPFSLCAAVLVCGFAFTVDPAEPRPTSPSAELRSIGRRIAAAVLKHDIETLLKYDAPKWRAEDQEALQDPNSDRTCYIFSGACSPTIPSVYDTLTGAKRLDIEVMIWHPRGNPLSGWLLFFDGTKIQRSKVHLKSYRCAHAGEIASWLFKRENGRWVGAATMFDLETDTLCSPN